MKTITIVGCGNIGSRHLQAITKLPLSISVDIVEPNQAAQKLARARVEEIPRSKYDQELRWHESISSLNRNSDLAIVATPSTGRSRIITDLLECGFSRFLVEKIVCQSVKEYETIISEMQRYSAKGWVNTPRRYYRSYQELRKYIQSRPIHMSVAAGNIGLGSNAIHFLDLFSWFCGDYDMRLTGALHERLFTNKRGMNLVEFAGTIIGASKNGSILEVSFIPSLEDMPLIVNIATKDIHLSVNESRERFIVESASGISNIKFQNELVSDTTTRIATDILLKDDCLLPTLQDSYFSHSELFRIFNDHIRKLTGQETEWCPIT